MGCAMSIASCRRFCFPRCLPESETICQTQRKGLHRGMTPMELLRQWFERDVRLVTWSEVEKLVEQSLVAEIRFSTERFTYTITVDANHGENYLGCTCFERTRRRGCDLPDGKFSKETWAEIMAAISENEILPDRPDKRSR
jgi:hypothetical protein